jgi:hypothetical protein
MLLKLLGGDAPCLVVVFWVWRGLIHSKGARASAASYPDRAALPALMRRAAHAVESKAVVRIEIDSEPEGVACEQE